MEPIRVAVGSWVVGRDVKALKITIMMRIRMIRVEFKIYQKFLILMSLHVGQLNRILD